MVEKNIPEEFNPDDIEIPIPEEKGAKIDSSKIKKCQVCGFYRRVCMCNKKSRKLSFKAEILQWIERWIERIKLKYHSSRYNRLIQKANKCDKKASVYGEKAIIHREFRESKINWDEVEFEGIEIKQSRGI